EWARSGRRQRRDIVLAFTADEEDTAAFGAQWLVERHPELFEGCTEAVGESGAFTFHAGPGRRLYPIASAERGTAWLKLTARGRAGHGSKPNDANAVTRLAEAVARIGAYRWPVRLIPTVRAAVEAIAAAAGTRLPDGALGAGAAGRGPGLGRRAVLHERRHRREAVLPARHDVLRLHPAGAARGVRLLRHVPRHRRAHPAVRS